MLTSLALVGASALLLLLATGCPLTVPVPPPAQDRAPDITLSAFVVQQPSGDSGQIESGKENVKATTMVSVTKAAHLMFGGLAANPGGVRDFTLTLSQGARTLAQVKATNPLPTSGGVPNQINIVGSNGAGAPGGTPIELTLNEAAVLSGVATNFNGMSSMISATYVPVDPIVLGGGSSGGGSSGGGSSGGGGGATTATAALTAKLSRPISPGVPPPADACRFHLTWTLTAAGLTGAAGNAGPVTRAVDLNPAPVVVPQTGPLESLDCYFNIAVDGLRTGTWSVSVSASDWQAQCQVPLATGSNPVDFTWGKDGCKKGSFP